ncbi:NADPH:quinone oxidoreductase family protein, partial [Patulibacter sp. S7RM1-6]
MRANVLHELVGPDGVRVEEVPEPVGAHAQSDAGRFVVEVHAAGVAWPDLLQTRGAYQFGVPVPYVPGGEVAGVVVEATPESGFAVGDRVASLTMWGGLAERALALPQYAVRLPDAMDWAAGAALYLNAATAWFAAERAGVAEGETVLVQGAGGGVGTAAIEVCRARGARTIAVVSSDEKAEAARRCGADEVVRADGPWLDAVRERTDGRGVEVVLDPVGGDRFTDSLRALDVGGRLVVIGFTGGDIPTVRANRLLLRNLTVTGIGLEPFDRRFPGTVRRISRAVEGLAADGRLRPLVGHRLPFERGADALRLLEERAAVGKVVVD